MRFGSLSPKHDAPATPVAAATPRADLLALLPIAAAVIVREGDGLRVDATNAAFRAAGIAAPLDAALSGAITAFLGGGATAKIAWQGGDPVEPRHYALTLSRLPRASDSCLVSAVDRTAEVATEQSLRREMTTDSLTGLPNRTGFGDRLEEMVAPGGRRFAVLVMDLDRFSRINACLGAMAGDELIITVARRVRSALRAGDVLARIGGDEFGIIVAIDERESEAEQVARRIRQALATPFRLSDYEIKVDCAIGIAMVGAAAPEIDDVIRHAQFAMKRSKRSGVEENYQFRAFDDARERFAMETALRRAIESNALTLAYQPICDLVTGRVEAFEALARWTDETGRDVPPSAFIPVAEESGLIVALGRWAIDRAVATLAQWDAAGGDPSVKMAVNLSPLQINRDAVWETVATALERHRVDGARLKLELTESALIDEPEHVASVLHALKALGSTIAMDDFGTGFSNLATLKALPIDVLKIDRSFVTSMLVDRDKMAIVKAILGLAQALGMKTVAEGIETRDLAQTLTALGCDYGQGFHFARPLRADAAYEMLVARNA